MSEEMKIQLHRSEVQLTAEDAQEWLSTRLCPGIREIRAVELMERGAVIPEKQWNPMGRESRERQCVRLRE